MSWIEYDEALHDFWKVKRLAKLLQVPYAHALGLVSCLWTWAVGNQASGVLKRFTDDEIAEAMRWEGRGVKMKALLRQAELIDKGSDKIHDWDKHGLRILNQARARKQRWREGMERDRNVPDSKKERKKVLPPNDSTTTTGFEAFWGAYPRKVNRRAAAMAWAKLAPDAALQARILAALSVQRSWPQWVKDGGQFIPHPSTWLNGRRWEDQPPSEAAMVAGGGKPRSVAEELSPAQRARLKVLTSGIGKPA